MDQGQCKYRWAHIEKARRTNLLRNMPKYGTITECWKPCVTQQFNPPITFTVHLWACRAVPHHLGAEKPSSDKCPHPFSLARCRNVVPLRKGTIGNFSPSCVLYVGDNIQQRTWLICRGDALAQLPPQSWICIWNNLHLYGYF